MGFMQGSTLYAGVINGFDSAVADDRTHWYLGGTVATPVTGLKLGASFDYTTADLDDTTPGGPARPYIGAYAAYLSFAASEKLSFHARGEYANADAAVASVLGTTKVFALTGTVQYDLWKNVLSRLEVRWDHNADGNESFGGDIGGAPDKKNYFTVAANLIYKF